MTFCKNQLVFIFKGLVHVFVLVAMFQISMLLWGFIYNKKYPFEHIPLSGPTGQSLFKPKLLVIGPGI